MNEQRDAYQRFFDELVSQDDFFKFGLQEIIFADQLKANICWRLLKDNFKDSKPLFIRSYGRKGVNSHLFLDL